MLSGILDKDVYKKIEEKGDRKRIFFYVIKNGQTHKVPLQNPSHQDLINYINVDIV